MKYELAYLMIPFLLTGCGQSGEDIAKPDLVADFKLALIYDYKNLEKSNESKRQQKEFFFAVPNESVVSVNTINDESIEVVLKFEGFLIKADGVSYEKIGIDSSWEFVSDNTDHPLRASVYSFETTVSDGNTDPPSKTLKVGDETKRLITSFTGPSSNLGIYYKLELLSINKQ